MYFKLDSRDVPDVPSHASMIISADLFMGIPTIGRRSERNPSGEDLCEASIARVLNHNAKLQHRYNATSLHCYNAMRYNFATMQLGNNATWQ